MAANIGYEAVGRVVCCVHTAQDPTDEEWSVYLRFLQTGRLCNRVFVYSIGGGPNSKQRRMLAEVTQGRTLPTAVVTPSRITRAIGVAVGWFNPHIQIFSPGYMREALAHLKLSERESVDVVYSARQLAKALSIRRAEHDLSVHVPIQQAG